MVIKDLPSILEARKPLIEQRTAFFSTVKTYLSPEHRPDAGDLNEPRWNHPARMWRKGDWTENAVRGYLVLREDRLSRPFRLSIEQPGDALVLEVSILGEHGDVGCQSKLASVQERLAYDGMGPGQIVSTAEGDSVRWSCRWHIPAPDIYTSVRALETAQYQIWRAFDAAVIHLIPA